MRWGDRKGSDNVEDHRDEDDGGYGFPFPTGGAGGGFPGGRIPIPMGSGGLGIVGVIVVVGLMLLFGIDPRDILQGGPEDGGGLPLPRTGQPLPRSSTDAPTRETPLPRTAPGGGQTASTEDAQKHFVSLVLGSTEEVWQEKFRQSGKTYQNPKLVLYRGHIRSGCGLGAAQMGPFYCPQDGKVYIDLAFYNELQRRFKVSGDFAQAYVIAHEVGHHVQTLLGITDKAVQAKARAGEAGGNAIQVRMELQADCLAGIWAYYAQNKLQIVEAGDIDEALNAAAAIGDDRIQRQIEGEVHPESFTHGSSAQRVRWFKRGFENGNFPSCDTFSASEL
jgi:predicted metalloprotease